MYRAHFGETSYFNYYSCQEYVRVILLDAMCLAELPDCSCLVLTRH